MGIQVNDRITLKNNLHGVVRYIGAVEGRSEDWVGIELDEACGSNDGSINGKRYFQCGGNHGLFVKYKKLTQRMKSIAEETVCGSQNDLQDSLWNAGPVIEKQPELPYTKMLFSGPKAEEKNEKQDNEEERKYKELFESAIMRWKQSLWAIQKRLVELREKVERMKAINKPIEENDTVVKLVEDILTAEKRGDEKKFQMLYETFKKEMMKYKINVD